MRQVTSSPSAHKLVGFTTLEEDWQKQLEANGRSDWELFTWPEYYLSQKRHPNTTCSTQPTLWPAIQLTYFLLDRDQCPKEYSLKLIPFGERNIRIIFNQGYELQNFILPDKPQNYNHLAVMCRSPGFNQTRYRSMGPGRKPQRKDKLLLCSKLTLNPNNVFSDDLSVLWGGTVMLLWNKTNSFPFLLIYLWYSNHEKAIGLFLPFHRSAVFLLLI